MTALRKKHDELVELCREDFEGPFPVDRLKQALSGQDAMDILAAHEEGCTVLHWACYSQQVTLDTVKWLVELYPEAVKSHADFEGVPLHRVCLNKTLKLDIVEYLVDLYPEALGMFWRGKTPLACVLDGGMYRNAPPNMMEIVRYLVNKDPATVRIPLNGDDGKTVVHQACSMYEVQLQLVQLLVEIWPESLAMRSGGMLPLHALFSTRRNSSVGSPVELVSFMLDKYPDSVQSWREGETLPLHMACRQGESLEVIQLVGTAFPEAHQRSVQSGLFPLHEYCLSDSSGKDDLDLKVLQYLVSSNPVTAQIRNSYGFLPITYAISPNRSFETIKLLLDQYPDAIHDAATFHAACIEGNEEVMHYFLAQNHEGLFSVRDDGKNILHRAATRIVAKDRLAFFMNSFPEGLKTQDDEGDLPLHVACDGYTGCEYSGAIAYLLARYPIAAKMKNRKGCLPLHLLFRHVYVEYAKPAEFANLVKIVLAANPNAVKVTDDEGMLPIHYACKDGHTTRTLKVLVDAYPSSHHFVSREHGLPLHTAAAVDSWRDTKAIEYLAGLAKDDLDTYVEGSGLPLHCAARSGDKDVFLFLLSARFRWTPSSPLLHAIFRDHELLDKATIVTRILKIFGGEVKMHDSKGAAPLHWAVASDVGEASVTRLLEMDTGALQLKDKSNSLPLHYALRYSDPSNVLDLLLTRYEAGVRVADVNGFLPMHVACRHGAPLATVKRLLELYPESASISDKRGELPLHKACRGGHLALVEFLAEENVPSVRQPNREGVLPVLLLCQRSGKQSFLADHLLETGTIWQLLRKHPEAILMPKVNVTDQDCNDLEACCVRTAEHQSL